MPRPNKGFTCKNANVDNFLNKIYIAHCYETFGIDTKIDDINRKNIKKVESNVFFDARFLYGKYIREKFPMKYVVLNDEEKTKNQEIELKINEQREDDIEKLAHYIQEYNVNSGDFDKTKSQARYILNGPKESITDELYNQYVKDNTVALICFLNEKIDDLNVIEKDVNKFSLTEELNNNIDQMFGIEEMNNEQENIINEVEEPINVINEDNDEFVDFVKNIDAAKLIFNNTPNYDSKDLDETICKNASYSFVINSMFKYYSKNKNANAEEDIKELSNLLTNKRENDENNIENDKNEDQNREIDKLFASKLLTFDPTKGQFDRDSDTLNYIYNNFDVFAKFYADKLGKQVVNSIAKDVYFEISKDLKDAIEKGLEKVPENERKQKAQEKIKKTEELKLDIETRMNNAKKQMDEIEQSIKENIQKTDEYIRNKNLDLSPERLEELKNAAELLRKQDEEKTRIEREKRVKEKEENKENSDNELIFSDGSEINYVLPSYEYIKKAANMIVENDMKKRFEENQFGIITDHILDGVESEPEIGQLNNDLYLKKNELKIFKTDDDKNKEESIKALEDYINYTSQRINEISKDSSGEIEKVFGNLSIEDPEFETRVKESIARIAKGGIVFKNLQKECTDEGYEFEGNYINSSRLVFDVLLCKYPLYEKSKLQNVFGIDPTKEDAGWYRKGVIDNIENNYKDISLDELNKKAKDNIISDNTKIINDWFNGCRTKEEYHNRFSSLVDKILSKEITVKGINDGSEAMQKTSADIGLAASHIVNTFRNANKELSGEPYQLNPTSIKKICDKKLDGELISDEFMVKFKKNLGIVPWSQLSDRERDGYITKDNSDPFNKVAYDKLNGIETKVGDKLLVDTVASYARLNEIHSNRGFWFWLTNPFQNWAEYSTLSDMEKVLKEKYGFSKNQLKEARDGSIKNISRDNVNQVSILSENKDKYLLLQSEYEERSRQRKAAIEKPISNLIHKEKEYDLNELVDNDEIDINNDLQLKQDELNKSLSSNESIIDTTSPEKKNVKPKIVKEKQEVTKDVLK